MTPPDAAAGPLRGTGLRALAGAWHAVAAAWHALDGGLAALERRGPWAVVGPLVAVQLAAIAAFAVTVRHNGWLYYQGGDQTWYYTSSWALANGNLPDTSIGWGWPFLMTPVTLFAGPSFLEGLPAIIILQIAVLVPLMLWALWSIGRRIGGARTGTLAAAVWIAGPFVLLLGFDPRYHERWVEQFMPQLLGLTGLGDFPSTVLVTVVAALVLRAVQENDGKVALLAGLVGGFTLGVKPANGPLLVGIALAVLLARRLRVGAVFTVALVPALVTLLLWKERGLGTSPLFALGATAVLAAGAGPLSAALPVAGVNLHRYVNFDWSHLNNNFLSLREFFWSPRLLEALPLAGALGAARRSVPAAGLLAGWLGTFFVVKGTSPFATVDSGSFWRLLMPSLPAYAILVAALPLLVPRVRRAVAGGATGAAAAGRLPARGPAPRSLPRPRLLLGTTFAVLAMAPLLLVATASRLEAGSAVRTVPDGGYVAVDSGYGLRATPGAGGTVQLAWNAATRPGLAVFYRVMRSSTDPLRCTPVPGGVTSCSLVQETMVAATRDTAITDTPGPGRWFYAVGTAANWLDDTTKGDLMLAARPVAVNVP